MADMTATGWDAAGAVNVIQRMRPWGPQGGRQALVQLNFTATNFLDGAHVYPSNGIPAPSPSTMGFPNRLHYIIPTSPFFAAGGAGTPTVPVRIMPWGFVVPTGGVSGTTPRNAGFIRIFGVRTATDFSVSAHTAEPVLNGTVQLRELTTAVAASDIGVTGITYTAYGLAYGD